MDALLMNLWVNRIDPVFSIPSGGGCDGKRAIHTDFLRYYDKNLQGWVIDTSVQSQDPDHVYALITVPGIEFKQL